MQAWEVSKSVSFLELQRFAAKASNFSVHHTRGWCKCSAHAC